MRWFSRPKFLEYVRPEEAPGSYIEFLDALEMSGLVPEAPSTEDVRKMQTQAKKAATPASKVVKVVE